MSDYQEPWETPPGGDYPPPDPYHTPPGPYPPPYQHTQGSAAALSVLSYCGILWIVGLIAANGDPRVRFHVNQGIILTVFGVILSVGTGILAFMLKVPFSLLPYGIGFLGGIAGFIVALLRMAQHVVCVILTICGIANAARGREKPLPIIGSLVTIIK